MKKCQNKLIRTRKCNFRIDCSCFYFQTTQLVSAATLRHRWHQTHQEYNLSEFPLFFFVLLPKLPISFMFAQRWRNKDFSYPLIPLLGFELASVRELHLFEGPLKGCSTNKATATHLVNGKLHSRDFCSWSPILWLLDFHPRLPPTFIIFWVPDGVVRRDGEKLSVALNKLVVQPESPWPAGMLENKRFDY